MVYDEKNLKKLLHTTVFTSLHAKLYTIADPKSCNLGHVANKQCTAAFVVTRILEIC